MLWPEKRDKDEVLGDKIPGRIDRTTHTTTLKVSTGYLPDALQGTGRTGPSLSAMAVRSGRDRDRTHPQRARR